MEEYILKIKNINKTYSNNKVLNNIFFKLKRGEVHGLIGENGAGKSTLVKILTGIVKPDKGSEIYIDDKKINLLNPSDIRKLGISVTHQEISLFPNLSVLENIVINNKRKVIFNRKKEKLLINNLIKEMKLENIDLDDKLGNLSLGKQQLVYLIRCIYSNPKILIMDEPSAALSNEESEILYKIIGILKRNGTSIIYISHKLEEVVQLSDRVTVLRDGSIIKTLDSEKININNLVKLMVGQEYENINKRPKKEFREKILEVRSVSVKNKLNNISFDLHQGEILGITGLAGSMKSEVVKTLFGLNELSNGEIYLEGKKVKINSPEIAIKNGICYLPEKIREYGLFMKQNLIVNVTSSSLQMFTQRFGLMDYKEEKKVTEKYIDRLDIRPHDSEIEAFKLSGGNQRKILFSKWLNTKPKIFIVDEPTSGVDIMIKNEIHKILCELADSGMSVIMISSDFKELLSLSDKVIIMKNGEIADVELAENISKKRMMMKGLFG